MYFFKFAYCSLVRGCRHGYGRMVVGFTELLQRWCESDVDSKNSIGKKNLLECKVSLFMQYHSNV